MHLKELDKALVAEQPEAPEKAKVRETYRVHDKELSNPESRKLYSENKPQLDATQRDIVERLRSDGYAVASVAEVFGADVWEALRADSADWTRHMERKVAAGTAKTETGRMARLKRGKPKKEKFFMGRRFKKTQLTLQNPWLELGASKRMLDTVNSYLQMWSKLSYADQWYSPPRGSEADRLGSMRWHRDYNDQHLVKVFVYLVDVDEGTGPLEYVPGSAKQGPYVNEWPWQPLGESYPPAEEFGQRIPESAVRTFTAPAGSMILCDTSGFHRGGFATDKSRNIFVYNYVSPAALEALVERNFRVDASGLDGVQRFALD